jgi:hypothetical protein
MQINRAGYEARKLRIGEHDDMPLSFITAEPQRRTEFFAFAMDCNRASQGMEDLSLNRQELSRLRVRCRFPGSPQKAPVAGAPAVQQSLTAADFH